MIFEKIKPNTNPKTPPQIPMTIDRIINIHFTSFPEKPVALSMAMLSIFSKIIAGEIPSYKIAENERFYAFLDVFPLVHGHTLVVPKQEVDKLYELNDDEVKPVYKTVPGWFTSLAEVNEYEKFPKELRDYVDFLEKELGVPIKMVSVGPDRKQTILR